MFLGLLLMAAVSVSQATWFSDMRTSTSDPAATPDNPTRGEIWPQPQRIQKKKKFFVVRSDVFDFKVTGKTCNKLEKALRRYKEDLIEHEKTGRAGRSPSLNETPSPYSVDFEGFLDELMINLMEPCEDLPHVDMDEHYELRINSEDFPNAAVLISQSIWGILRGLESWSQLIYFSSEQNALLVNTTSILDFPRFSHRGILIDTSRHFLPIRIIYAMLDAMVMSKMNVLHWHVVDDQSFPFQSQVFPTLSASGAYAPTHVYTPPEVQSVIAYAADRGIRVIPEFDTPGHTLSWGKGHPELLTKCYSRNKPEGKLGPMNPIAPETYNFMKEFLKEIKTTFPDSFIHLGGDEVSFECWESNPEIQDFINARNWTGRKLEEMFVTNLIEMTAELLGTPVIWQEVFDNGAVLPNDTIIQVWKPDCWKELYDVTRKGHKVILSSCWYLDGLSSGGDWKKFYWCDPHNFPGNDQEKRLVIGGEACMWGEDVDANNILPRVWPRACAAAEKLWSNMHRVNIKRVAERLSEHTCRMNRRKIPAQPPNGPGFCPGVNFK